MPGHTGLCDYEVAAGFQNPVMSGGQLLVCDRKLAAEQQPPVWVLVPLIDMHATRSYSYTAADVQRMVAQKRARGGGGRNLAAEKARLMRVREHAREMDDAEAHAECALPLDSEGCDWGWMVSAHA